MATVRLSAPQQDSFDIEPSAERLRMRNVPLRRAIQFAWGLHEYQMSGGPKWVDNDYDIVGKPSEDLSALSFNDRVG